MLGFMFGGRHLAADLYDMYAIKQPASQRKSKWKAMTNVRSTLIMEITYPSKSETTGGELLAPSRFYVCGPSWCQQPSMPIFWANQELLCDVYALFWRESWIISRRQVLCYHACRCKRCMGWAYRVPCAPLSTPNYKVNNGTGHKFTVFGEGEGC